mgnify:CR=1 FL=1
MQDFKLQINSTISDILLNYSFDFPAIEKNADF